MDKDSRYYVRGERSPVPKPSGWRGLWHVWDRARGTIRESFWSWGAADKYARCLNGDLSPFLCRDVAPQQSHADRQPISCFESCAVPPRDERTLLGMPRCTSCGTAFYPRHMKHQTLVPHCPACVRARRLHLLRTGVIAR